MQINKILASASSALNDIDDLLENILPDTKGYLPMDKYMQIRNILNRVRQDVDDIKWQIE